MGNWRSLVPWETKLVILVSEPLPLSKFFFLSNGITRREQWWVFIILNISLIPSLKEALKSIPLITILPFSVFFLRWDELYRNSSFVAVYHSMKKMFTYKCNWRNKKFVRQRTLGSDALILGWTSVFLTKAYSVFGLGVGVTISVLVC